MKKTILSARGLCKSFAHNGGQVHIISNLDVDIYEGEFTVIMGASGSGKSTLLYALSGMDRATAGEVLLDGRNIAAMSERELAELRHTKFGFVFQQMHLVSNLSLMENVSVTGFLDKKKTAAESKTKAAGKLKADDWFDLLDSWVFCECLMRVGYPIIDFINEHSDDDDGGSRLVSIPEGGHR